MKIDRGKRKDNGEWVYGFYVAFAAYKGEEIKHYIQTLNDNNTLGLIYEVIPETVSYFIGLQDKHGKKIFEKDKICITYSDISGEVHSTTIIINDITNYELMEMLDHANQLEVIGNIHDNPELLEVSHA